MREINRSLTRYEAKESYYSGNFARSFRLTEAMAYEGDVKAEYSLGYMYYYGIGAPENKPLGMAWIREAALKGYPPAVFAIRKIEMDPLNFSEQESKVKTAQMAEPENSPDDLNKLALIGDKDAQYTLGYMYYYGKGIAQNKELGMSLIKLSAENGNSKAIVAKNKLDEFMQALSEKTTTQIVTQGVADTSAVEHELKASMEESETPLKAPKKIVNADSEFLALIEPKKELTKNLINEKAASHHQWVAQLFTFSVKDNAIDLIKKLQKQKLPAFAKHGTGKDKNLSVVFLGPANSIVALDELISKIDKKYGLTDVIVRKDVKVNENSYAQEQNNNSKAKLSISQDAPHYFCKENPLSVKTKITDESTFIMGSEFWDTLS